MEVDPVVLGILSFIGAGMIVAVLIVTLCALSKKCSFCDYKPRLSVHDPYRSRDEDNSALVLASKELQDQTLATTVKLNSFETNISSLKRSTGDEALPTYQTATEYPRVYAGQCYVGMSGESEVQPWMSHQNMDHFDKIEPPDYHQVVP